MFSIVLRQCIFISIQVKDVHDVSVIEQDYILRFRSARPAANGGFCVTTLYIRIHRIRASVRLLAVTVATKSAVYDYAAAFFLSLHFGLCLYYVEFPVRRLSLIPDSVD